MLVNELNLLQDITMNKSLLRLFSIVASGLVTAPAFAGPSTAPSVPDAPSAAATPATPVAPQAAKPDQQAAMAFLRDFRPVAMKLIPLMQQYNAWSDPVKRKAKSEEVQPDLKKAITMIDDESAKGHAAEVELVGATPFINMAAVFGDADLKQQLDTMSKKSDTEGAWAKVALADAGYWLAGTDADAQGKALDAMEALVTSDRQTKNSVARAELEIYQSKPSKEIAARIDTYVTQTLKNTAIAQIKESQAAEATRAGLVNKPLVLAGPLRDGSQFTTADLKGKVILVDFWASWCGPCKAELPRVKKMYAEYHEQGLEVIGVSCDYKADDLAKFLQANPDMPWTQMFDSTHTGWNQLAKDNGIVGIPTMFLIDKNGICRSVTAREDFEKEIPKLLAEKPEKAAI